MTCLNNQQYCWLVVGSVSEGCADLESGLEDVKMTTDGVIIIEEAGPEESAVSLESASEEIKLEVSRTGTKF